MNNFPPQSARDLVPYYDFTHTIYNSPSQGLSICKSDPDRIAIIVGNTTGAGTAMVVSQRAQAVLGAGYAIPPNDFRRWTYSEYGALVGLEWFYANNSLVTIIVTEIFYRGNRQGN